LALAYQLVEATACPGCRDSQHTAVVNQRYWPSFLARRWRSEVPMHTLLWRDMLGVGTVVNMLFTFMALMATSQGAPFWAAAAIHFAPLPYNLFLFAAVVRAVPRNRIAAAVSFVWLALITVV
jgi:hypothetical protein